MRVGDMVRTRDLAVVDGGPGAGRPGSGGSAAGGSASGGSVRVPAGDRLTHLQFRRFAGCPVCNLHLRSIVRRHDEIEAAGIREVVFFHSPAAELLPYAADLPFALVADPDKRVYREFGVRSGRRALLDPRVWPTILRGIGAGLLRRDKLPKLMPAGGRFGLPADFLVAGDGRVLAVKHGTHAYDQWSVDELLDMARASTRVP